MATIKVTENLVTTSCWCGINYAIPAPLDLVARENGQTVYCPLGHQWSYTEPEIPAMQKKLDAAVAARRAAEDQLAAANRERERQATRTKNGVCPCCNRSFVQLARHMKSQHPDFDGNGK